MIAETPRVTGGARDRDAGCTTEIAEAFAEDAAEQPLELSLKNNAYA
jgi:hypothetical protein